MCLKVCSRCMGPWYCSKSCQEKAWKTHRLYCGQAFAENAMHQLFVHGLDAWWERTATLVERFGVRPPIAPEDKPDWGLRIGFLFDPSGVLWQVSEPLASA